MKIKCPKGYSAKKALQLATEYVEKLGGRNAILSKDLEVDIFLQEGEEKLCPDADKTVMICDEDMKRLSEADTDRDY